jgi:ABC-2 type transport system ATP-binding protein
MTRVRFRLPPDVTPPDRLGAAREAAGWAIETDAPTRAMHALTGWAIEAGHELADLEVTRRSLEDVYLQLTAEAEVGA